MDHMNRIVELTNEARSYALKELARRAGVDADFFRSWKIQFTEAETVVHLQPGTHKQIRFKNALYVSARALVQNGIGTRRALWMHPPADTLEEVIPDFAVPFSANGQEKVLPLFAPDGESVVCSLDLLGSTLLTLSRFEEVLASEKDIHGRFQAKTSVAFRDKFLHRPIVDEYGLALQQAICYLLPAWKPATRRLRVKLSQDVDTVGLPFSWKAAIGHTLRRHRLSASVRDIVGRAVGLRPAYLECVARLARMSLEHSVDSTVYWKASPKGQWDTGYDPSDAGVQEIIHWLQDHDVENGVHPGYETFDRPEKLREEAERMRRILGQEMLGGRQHYLRWSPSTWQHWEVCGLAYDSTVGYADHCGFRAGTCVPYRPWLLSLNREANLIEIPLIVMDKTLTKYMRLTPQQSLATVFDLLAKCRVVGGVFTLLWHNTSMIKRKYTSIYVKILDAVANQEHFDWRTPSNDMY